MGGKSRLSTFIPTVYDMKRKLTSAMAKSLPIKALPKVMPSKALATKVLSAKVTPDVYNGYQALAKNTNRTVSECLRDSITFVNGRPMLTGEDNIAVPDDLTRTLGAIGGGTVVGIIGYKALKYSLSNRPGNTFTEQEIEAISMLVGVVAGLIVGTGIHKALSK